MMASGISRVRVRGHTSIKDASLELGRITLLVGANGSGKSNLVRALEMLGRIADQRLELYVAQSGGASMILRQPKGRRMDPGLVISAEGGSGRYEATLVSTADNRLVFEQEEFESPLVDGAFTQPSQGLGVGESILMRQEPGPLGDIRAMLSGCRVFHFHDTSSTAPVKQPGPTADNLRLASDAGNLAAFLAALRETETAAYRRILGAVRQVAPFLDDLVLREEGRDQIRLRWTQTDSDTVFSAHQLSDGTLRFLCLATLLLQPDRPALVVLDEPELGLHPYAIVQLAEMIKAASVTGQVVVATQSVTLIDQFTLDDILVVERGRNGSRFERPSPDGLRDWLDDYSLGELWQKNLIGGRPRRDVR